MNELFPLAALNPKQSVVVGELLRDHPHGRVEDHAGKPVFATQGKSGPVYVRLSPSLKPNSRPPQSRNPFE
jgi:hypothetical protein